MATFEFILFFLSLGVAFCHLFADTDQLPPNYLYKILSKDNWKASQDQLNLHLTADDDAFIHLATSDQLANIIKKYWSHASEFIVLKIDTSMLHGKLVLESNPGGTNKYYHLYNGSIPLTSVIETKITKSSK